MIYVLEIHKETPQKFLTYTEPDEGTLIRKFEGRFKIAPYTLEVVGDITYARRHWDEKPIYFDDMNVIEEWVYWLYDEHGILAHIYYDLDAIKQDLTNPKGALAEDCNVKARMGLLELYMCQL